MSDVISYVEQEMIRMGLATPRPPTVIEVERADAQLTPLASNANDDSVTDDGTETPSIIGDFCEPSWFKRFKLYMTNPKFRGASLFGPRGTGKTTSVRQLAAILSQRVIVFQCAGGMTIDDLVGVRDIRNGATMFTPGPLTLAIMNDVWLVLEEANNLGTSVPAAINTLTDGSGTPLRTKDGKIHAVGKNFRCVLCYNEGSAYSGTREVNAALKDRLPPIYCNYMSEDNERALLRSRTEADDNTCDNIVKLANACRASIKSTGFDFSPRSMVAMIELVKELGCTWKDAFEWAILDKVGDPIEKATQRSVLANIAEMSGITSWFMPVFHDTTPDVVFDTSSVSDEEDLSAE